MNSGSDFRDVQYRFAAHIRDPQSNPAPEGIEERRMRVYSELFYNNVEDFIASSFPVLREITDDDAWHRLIRDYFSRHKAKTPLFPEMPREFLHYLEHEYEPAEGDRPFMLELAHYEWVEAALYFADEEQALDRIDPDADLLTGLPALSSLSWLLSYNFPVHRIGNDFLPTEPSEQPTHLLVYRDTESEIQYLELNPLSMRLLYMIKSAEVESSQQALEAIAAEIQHPDPEVVIQGGLSILQDLKLRGAILGCRKA
jgi:hypothetical protein